MAFSDNESVEYRERPFSADEAKAFQDENGFIAGNVRISIDDIVNGDSEDFFDKLSDLLIGGPWLNEVSFSVAGHVAPTWVILSVSGYVEDCDFQLMR